MHLCGVRMKTKRIIIILLMFLSAALLFACEKADSTIIKFVTNGGNEIADVVLEEGRLSALPEPPHKNGYAFDGWYYDKENLYPCDLTQPQTIRQKKEITLYAKWSLIHYPVQYDLDGGHFEHEFIIDYNYTIESGLVLPLPGNVYKEGYSFTGWTDGQTLCSVIPAGETGEKHFIATWAINSHDFTFAAENENCGSVSGTEGHIVFGESVSVSATVNYGYLFDGWYDGEVKLSSDPEYTFAMPDKRLHLVARWSVKTSRITFRPVAAVGSVGEVRLSPFTAQVGSPIQAPVVSPENTPEGMKLVWYLKSDFTQLFEFDKMPDNDTLLYGRWESTGAE